MYSGSSIGRVCATATVLFANCRQKHKSLYRQSGLLGKQTCRQTCVWNLPVFNALQFFGEWRENEGKLMKTLTEMNWEEVNNESSFLRLQWRFQSTTYSNSPGRNMTNTISIFFYRWLPLSLCIFQLQSFDVHTNAHSDAFFSRAERTGQQCHLSTSLHDFVFSWFQKSGYIVSQHSASSTKYLVFKGCLG